MLARREAIDGACLMDERFLMDSEETEVCWRIRRAGWGIRRFPWVTILPYGAKVGVEPSVESLSAHSRTIDARRHFSPAQRAVFFGVLLLRHSLRFVCAGRGEAGTRRRTAHRAALTTLLGLSPPPHSPWGRCSVCTRKLAQSPRPVRTHDPASV
jgi:GT2 family glycosyltransferase